MAPVPGKSPLWLRLLPAPLRARIEHRFGLRRALINTGWLFGDRLLRMGVGLVVWMLMARYLGPGQFGSLNYALAFVSLFGAVASLGLNGIVVRDLVEEPEDAGTTLGTALVLQLAGGLLAFCAAVALIGLIRPDDSLVRLMVILLGSLMVFKATDVVKYWYESQVQSKYVVWVENSAFLLFAVVKILLILVQAPLIAFVWTLFAEGVFVSIGLLGMYAWREGSLHTWKGRARRAGQLLRDSWPLTLSALAVMAYLRIDQIMIGQMMGDDAVGIYSAAVRISEVWYFIPMAIVASVFPAIIEARKQEKSVYLQRLQKLYDLMVLLALLVAVPVTIFADGIMLALFGEAYQAAGAVLAVHIWAGVFVFLGVASSKWFLIENLQNHAFYRTALGLLVNVASNLLLIPKYGVMGAAIATLLSQVVAAWLYDAIQKSTRPSFVLKTGSLLPFLPGVRGRAHPE
jgi:PST family polysaccharide transporter